MTHIEPIPLLQDNYAWVIHDGHHAVIVDPSYAPQGEASPILAWLGSRRIRATAILITHHHRDHTGGIGAIAAEYRVAVYGPAGSAIPGITHPVADGDRIHLDDPLLEFTVLAVPGHTLDHLVYTLPGHLFCGDALFSCGCGRVFEGTPTQMQHSLARLRDLPDATQIYCAHEYTLENLAFARHIEPEHPKLRAWETEAERLRDAGLPTLPVTLGDERQRNPFLRWDDPAIQDIAKKHGASDYHDPGEVFAAIRALRDRY